MFDATGSMSRSLSATKDHFITISKNMRKQLYNY
jgi:hypothetical protein